MNLGKAGSDTSDPREAKKQLRLRGKQTRARVMGQSGPQAAQRLAEHGLDFCEPQPSSVISGFAAFGEELDATPLMVRLAQEGHTLALPVMVAKAQPLIFRAWKPGDPMKEAMWGIMEPVDEAPLAVPDVLLVPLLAFDERGYRVGYGGGFYDRTIAGLCAKKPITTVGLALDELKVPSVPTDQYDQPLDWVLTPGGPIRCTG